MHKTRKSSKLLAQGLMFLMVTVLMVGCGGGGTTGTTGNLPITIEVLDGGGVLKVLKPVLENYRKTHPNMVKAIEYLPPTTAPAIPGKIKAQESANKQDISLVLAGYDVVASGIQNGLWEQLTPNHADKFPNLDSNYQAPAKAYADLAQGYALPVAYTPSGPLFEYDPAKVPNPPRLSTS